MKKLLLTALGFMFLSTACFAQPFDESNGNTRDFKKPDQQQAFYNNTDRQKSGNYKQNNNKINIYDKNNSKSQKNLNKKTNNKKFNKKTNKNKKGIFSKKNENNKY